MKNYNVFSFGKPFTAKPMMGERNLLPLFGINDLDSDSAKWIDSVDVRLNSDNFRCDNFIKKNDKHDGKHILFAGCSNTWGVGLKENEIWSRKVLSSISLNEKVSGYFNIGCPGIGISQIVSWIFKYINTYGKPDAIFVLLPNLGRFFSCSENTDALGASHIQKDDLKINEGSIFISSHVAFELYSMLEDFCKIANIELFSTSWSCRHDVTKDNWHQPKSEAIGITDYLFHNAFESYHSLNDNEMNEQEFIYSYISQNPDVDILARDNIHPGEPTQEFWAQRLVRAYNEKDI